jgi:hypothetical protein
MLGDENYEMELRENKYIAFLISPRIQRRHSTMA